MKLRHILERIGIRRKTQTYGYVTETFDLGRHGRIGFAQWQHPKYRRFVLDTGQIEELQTILSPGDAVIDVGSHTGNTSVLFAAAVGKTGKVFAVEPNPYLRDTLEANVSLNPDAAPIEIMPFAAVVEPGQLTFNYSDAGFCNGGDLSFVASSRHNHLYQLEVDGRNLADELQADHQAWVPHIRLIKSDTEGNDMAVIESMKDIITKHRPYIICEVYRHQTPEQREQLFALLHDELEYTLYRADLWTSLRGEEITDRTLSGDAHFDIFCVPRATPEAG